MRTRLLRSIRHITRNDLFELCVCIAMAGLFVLLSSGVAFGQGNVGINNPTPHAKSLLDLTSSDKGLLTPRMTAAQRTSMFSAPDATAKGMLVYQTDGTQGYYYYDGAIWQMLQSGGPGWGLLGDAGTDPATHFVGTTDAQGFAMRTNNTERVRVDVNGNVGIGTSTPGRKLDVLDAGAGLVARFQGTNANGYSMVHWLRSDNVGAHIGFFNPGIGLPLAGNFVMGTFGNAPVSFTTNDFTRMHITTAGNVGVGTSAPVRLLEVASPNQGVQRISSANAVHGSVLELNNATAGSNVLGAVNFLDGSGPAALGQLMYHKANGMTINTAGAERLRIDTNGNVGIGVAAPLRPLHLEGAVAGAGLAYVRNTDPTGWSGIDFGSAPAGALAFVGFNNASQSGYVGTASAHAFRVFTNGTARVHVNATGEVGIGTSAPTSQLEVNGYTKLGSNAPAIRQIELTGTTAANEGTFVDIAHGLTGGKIISVTVLIEYAAGNWIPTGYTINPEYLADFVVGATNIRLYNHNGSSGNILSKPVKVLITYKA